MHALREFFEFCKNFKKFRVKGGLLFQGLFEVQLFLESRYNTLNPKPFNLKHPRP